MIALLWILALVLPKAGTYISDVPVTIASILVVLYGGYYFVYSGYPGRRKAEGRMFTRYYLVYAWLLVVTLIANLSTINTTDMTTWLLMIASPLAFYAGLRANNPRRAMFTVLVATGAVGLYALVQNLFGVEETAIPGVTHLFGEDLINGNPIRTPSGTLKSPSTYHNGNLAASFLLLGMGFALFAHRINPRLKAVSRVAFIAAAIGVAVSLARAAALGFAIAALIALLPRFRPSWVGPRIARVAAGLLVVVSTVLFAYILTGSESFLFERYVIDSLDDPSGAGRTDGYSAWFSTLRDHGPGEFVKVVLFGDGNVDPLEDQLEGFIAIFAKHGVFVLASFLALLALPLRMMRRVRGSDATVIWFGFVASAAMWLIDNTFFYPPTLMNWFLLAGLAVQLAVSEDESGQAVTAADRRQSRLALAS